MEVNGEILNKDLDDCMMYIIKFYKDRMIESLKRTLEPFEEKIREKPLTIRITLGEC